MTKYAVHTAQPDDSQYFTSDPTIRSGPTIQMGRSQRRDKRECLSVKFVIHAANRVIFREKQQIFSLRHNMEVTAFLTPSCLSCFSPIPPLPLALNIELLFQPVENGSSHPTPPKKKKICEKCVNMPWRTKELLSLA